MIEYKLLNDGSGVLLSRQPMLVDNKTISFKFNGGKNGATAIFINEKGHSFYREIENDICTIPKEAFIGIVKVKVSLFDGTVNSPRWICEELQTHEKNGLILVAPNDTNLSATVVNLKIEISNLKEKIESQDKKIKKIEEKIKNTFDGYDVL